MWAFWASAFPLHQAEAAGWGWNGCFLRFLPSQPIRSQSGWKKQISEKFFGVSHHPWLLVHRVCHPKQRDVPCEVTQEAWCGAGHHHQL